MFHPDDLKYFMEISKTLHLTRAAERLGVTQPTLSHCLNRMEHSIGTSLFLRSKKGMTLTPAGQRLADESAHLLEHWESVLQSVKNEITAPQGTIRLGCHTAVAQYMLPRFLGDFLNQYPLIRIQLQHGLSRHLAEEVISGKLDLSFVVNPVRHPDLVIKELEKDIVTVWKAKNCKNLETLFVEPQLLQSQNLLSQLSKKGIHFSRVLESSSLEVIANLVAHGIGCGILPERVIRAFESEKVVQWKDAPEFEDKICLIYKPELKTTERGRVLLNRII